MNFSAKLIAEIGRASALTLPQLEAALLDSEERTVSELTALTLAKKAAEGGMDAVKLIRELLKNEVPSEQGGVEIRVIPPEDEDG